MPPADRAWLVGHLHDQLENLTAMAGARDGPIDEASLVALRDQIFVIRETLDTLGVPHALSSNADWSRAIGTKES